MLPKWQHCRSRSINMLSVYQPNIRLTNRDFLPFMSATNTKYWRTDVRTDVHTHKYRTKRSLLWWAHRKRARRKCLIIYWYVTYLACNVHYVFQLAGRFEHNWICIENGTRLSYVVQMIIPSAKYVAVSRIGKPPILTCCKIYAKHFVLCEIKYCHGSMKLNVLNLAVRYTMY